MCTKFSDWGKLIFFIWVVLGTGCDYHEKDPDHIYLTGDVFIYQANVTDQADGKSYIVGGELTIHWLLSEIRLLSYDGNLWSLKIRNPEYPGHEAGVSPFYIDLQSIRRDNEIFMVNGRVHDPESGTFNGFYYEGAQERLEFSYQSTLNGKSMNVSILATEKK